MVKRLRRAFAVGAGSIVALGGRKTYAAARRSAVTGRYVSRATTGRQPRTSVTEAPVRSRSSSTARAGAENTELDRSVAPTRNRRPTADGLVRRRAVPDRGIARDWQAVGRDLERAAQRVLREKRSERA